VDRDGVDEATEDSLSLQESNTSDRFLRDTLPFDLEQIKIPTMSGDTSNLFLFPT
jgi:hypothetical protein